MLARVAPTPRAGVYELYWQFAARRQAAFEKRITGLSAPWSDDPILQQYKFCNVFRASDRVSQYLIRDVIYADQLDASMADRLFQIVAFRTFSKIETWEYLKQALCRQPLLEDLRSGAFCRALVAAKKQGAIYTSAFILCANKAFGFDEKHENHDALFRHMFFEADFAGRCRGANALEQVVALIQSFPLMGPFMAYQTAIDLNYSELISFSENDYTQAGPGALRGIAKTFSDTGSYKPADIIMMMVEGQEQEFERLGHKFNGLFGRKLHAIDCQGLFCETDKYCRAAVPELKSARTRIKAKFAPQTKPVDLFFPPKWGINDKLPASI